MLVVEEVAANQVSGSLILLYSYVGELAWPQLLDTFKYIGHELVLQAEVVIAQCFIRMLETPTYSYENWDQRPQALSSAVSGAK
jgi:hypothetical protein